MTSDRYATEKTDAAQGERPATVHYAMMLPTSRGERLGFVARAALVIAAVFVGLFVFWAVREAFLLLLLAIVVATVLTAAAAPVLRHTGLSPRWSLTLVAVVLFLAIGGMGWLMGSQIGAQVGQ